MPVGNAQRILDLMSILANAPMASPTTQPTTVACPDAETPKSGETTSASASTATSGGTNNAANAPKAQSPPKTNNPAIASVKTPSTANPQISASSAELAQLPILPVMPVSALTDSTEVEATAYL